MWLHLQEAQYHQQPNERKETRDHLQEQVQQAPLIINMGNQTTLTHHIIKDQHLEEVREEGLHPHIVVETMAAVDRVVAAM